MSQINVAINGRDFRVACEDGQEDHVRQLAQYVNSHIQELIQTVGQAGDTRLLVLASLVIADELAEMVSRVEELEESLGDLKRSQSDSNRKANCVEGKVSDILEAAAKRIEDLTEQVDGGRPIAN